MWPGQASEHDADHGEADEGCGGSCVALEVARKTPVVADPCQGPLDDPAFGENDEAMELVAFDDLEFPSAGLGDGRGGLRSLIAGIGEDALDKGKEAAGAPVENERRAIAILNVGRMDDDVQQEAERVDENMPFAARNLLARIEALRVDRGAPF